MIWAAVIGCSTSTPAEDPFQDLRRHVGLASRSDDAACEALESVFAHIPDAEGALAAGRWKAVAMRAPGLTEHNGKIVVDWPELGLAVGPGPANTAFVTVGGLHRDGCLNVDAMSRWTLRAKTLDSAPSCMRERLGNAFHAAWVEQLSGCACSEDPLHPAVPTRLENAGLIQSAATARSWTPTLCE